MEKYFLPFQRAIDANVSGVMCSYNRVNGTYACVDPVILGGSGILKGYGGHKGYIVSDWGATHGNAAELANAGLDVEYVVSRSFEASLSMMVDVINCHRLPRRPTQ